MTDSEQRELFMKLGELTATSSRILSELESIQRQIDRTDTKYMTKDETLSRLRELRATTIIAVFTLALSLVEGWHWIIG
jgi:hypothetical protein